jgi:hypothetical protein
MRMKRLTISLLIAWLIQTSLLAQGVVQFTMDFPGVPPPPAILIPYGAAQLSGGTFSVGILLGPSEATYAWILQQGDSGSLTPIFQIGGENLSISPITGAPSYSLDQSWVLTDAQTQSLLAGQWFAEVDFGADTHLGQITAIPEPSVAALFVLCFGFLVIFYQRRSLR